MLPIPSQYRYDLFISHSEADKGWVRDWLVPRLERASLTVYLPGRDFTIGAPKLRDIEVAVERSRRMLLILTPAWVASKSAALETLLSQTRDPSGMRTKILPVLLKACSPPRRIEMLHAIDFTDGSNHAEAIARLIAMARAELPPPDEVFLSTTIAPAPPPLSEIGPDDPPPAARGDRAPALNIGSLLGDQRRYQIERLLGKGGFGETYLARDRQLRRPCVVKHLVFDPAWSAANVEAVRQAFRREARLLSTLNTPGHPNIPEIYDFLSDSDCLVMKYIEGANLRAKLQEHGGRLPEDRALAYVRDVCRALIYMHGRAPQPVLHRDIKPENILVGADDRVWLVDFGLAKAASAQGSGYTPSSMIAGTPGFAPIEQWRGGAEPRSDVYALAATLYVLVTGVAPQRDAAGGLVPARDGHVSSAVERLIAHAMAEQIADRPTAQAFLSELDAVVAGRARPQLQAPDGTRVAAIAQLSYWLERNWEQAERWLYGDLPGQIRAAWGDLRLADELEGIARAYPSDRGDGLDAALARIDPDGFGAAAPELRGSPATLEIGAGRHGQLKLTNVGRRHVRAQVARPDWLRASIPTVDLPPGEACVLTFDCEPGGRPWFLPRGAAVDIRQGRQTLLTVQVRAAGRR